MKIISTLLALLLTVFMHGQSIDFEDLGLPVDSFINDAGDTGVFEFDNIFSFPNDYNTDYDFWSGWAISSATDVTTPGFTNQYSSIVGSGAEGSNTYMTTFASPSSSITLDQASTADLVLDNISISNGTYAYLSMLNGDDFAKKFGGESGDDPDFFLLTIKGFFEGEAADSIDFYLADYRFEDNSQDYILDTWEEIDLLQLGFVDSLSFSLSSSDVGQFGMNTPAYFCLDNLNYSLILSNKELQNASAQVDIFPNPATEYVRIDMKDEQYTSYMIYNITGQLITRGALAKSNTIDLSTQQNGQYMISLLDETGRVKAVKTIVKTR